MGSMPQTIDEEQAKSLPLSVRYLNCTKKAESLCEQHKFNSRCWIERDDVTPPTKQLDHPRHQVKRHPGFRHHQLKSRVLVFLILEILGSALNDWGDVTIVGKYQNYISELLLLTFTNLLIFISTSFSYRGPSIGWRILASD